MKQSIKRAVLVVGGILVVGFVAMQLVPINRINPPVVSEPNWDSPQTRELAQRACFDCHSNETTWPWYSYVAPASWLVAHDVQEGRRSFNFSDWQNVRGERRGAGEMAEVIRTGWMPPASYLLTHPQAHLTQAEQDALIQGLSATLSNN